MWLNGVKCFGSATFGQYLDLQPYATEILWNSKKNDVLSKIW